MKKSELKRIIREEIQRLDEGADPTIQQMLKFVKQKFPKPNSMFWDDVLDPVEFNMIEGIYWYAAENHTGQGSNLYKAMGDIKRTYGYKPAPSSGHIPYPSMEVYRKLLKKFG